MHARSQQHMKEAVHACRLRRQWSQRRKRGTVVLFIEASMQIINLTFFVVPNVYVLVRPCGWRDDIVLWSAFVSWTCWNTLFLLSVVRTPCTALNVYSDDNLYPTIWTCTCLWCHCKGLSCCPGIICCACRLSSGHSSALKTCQEGCLSVEEWVYGLAVVVCTEAHVGN